MNNEPEGNLSRFLKKNVKKRVCARCSNVDVLKYTGFLSLLDKNLRCEALDCSTGLSSSVDMLSHVKTFVHCKIGPINTTHLFVDIAENVTNLARFKHVGLTTTEIIMFFMYLIDWNGPK